MTVPAKHPIMTWGRLMRSPPSAWCRLRGFNSYPFNVNEGFVCCRRAGVHLHDLERCPRRDYIDCRMLGGMKVVISIMLTRKPER